VTGQDHTEPTDATAEQKIAAYHKKMAALFAKRDTHPVDSPERTAVAEKILTLWVEEGD
jgi:hypothetical protein